MPQAYVVNHCLKYFKAMISNTNMPAIRKPIAGMNMAGTAGLEPANARIKIWCLTT